jgi:hypothetical protein
MNAEADVSRVTFDMRGTANAKIDSTQFSTVMGVNHEQVISRHAMDGVGRKSFQYQPEFAIHQLVGIGLLHA